MPHHRILLILICSLSLASSVAAYAEQTLIAVAANFSAPMHRLVLAFQQETGHHVKPSAGATGKFYAQIQNGAPYDALLAADHETPERLEREQFGIAHTRFTYATGTIALWSAREAYIDSKGEILQKAAFQHLAIADPKLAPYGNAAQQTLMHLGLLDKLKDKLVQGENISQTYQFIASGNAECGFVALSQIFFDGKLKQGSAWVVPAQFHPPLHQDAILLKAGKDNPAAKAFLAFLKTEKAKTIMRDYGYQF